MRRLVASLVVSALLVLGPGVGRAQPAVEQARVYFDAGVQAYSAGRFAAAVEAFTAAYALASKPTVLFSLAQAERRQFTVSRDPRSLRDAIAHFRKYLDEVPEGGRRNDAVEALAELEVMAGRMDPQALAGASATRAPAPPGARIVISTPTKDAVIALDGVEHRDLPVVQELTPGKHTVHASAKGYYDEEREIVAVEGLLIPLEFILRERPSFFEIDAPPGATVSIDGRSQGEAPLGRSLDVSPGSHFITVTRTGYYPYAETMTLERGEVVPVRVTLRRTRQRKVSFGILGVGAAALVTAGALGAGALAEEATLRSVWNASRAGNITQARLDAYNHALAARDGLRTASMATLGGSAALGLLGLGLFVFDDPPPPVDAGRRSWRPRAPSVSLVLTPAAATVGVRVGF